MGMLLGGLMSGLGGAAAAGAAKAGMSGLIGSALSNAGKPMQASASGNPNEFASMLFNNLFPERMGSPKRPANPAANPLYYDRGY